MQSFQISYRDVFGTNVSHDLKDNGSAIPVTAANRQVATNVLFLWCGKCGNNPRRPKKIVDKYCSLYIRSSVYVGNVV